MDEIFDRIIQAALAEAAGIECSASEYRTQLNSWISEIRTAVQASAETDCGDDD